MTLTDVPYTIERALHFSNGGGVYAGTDSRTGEPVVLKEARPHAGLAADGADAVARLHRERTALERLEGLDCVPSVRGTFTVGDHHFLVLQYLEGKPLNTYFARRHPLIEAEPDPEELASYTRWALTIHRRVTEAVEAVHARGVVFNDLHLFNIMVAEDEDGEPSVALLDFEAAAHVDEGLRQTVANPAFVAPAGRRGFSVDRYALACLRLALFLPLTSLFVLDRAKAAHLADIAAEQFPVPRAFLDEAVEEILYDPPPGEPGHRPTVPTGPYLPVEPGDWSRARASMTAALRASATLDREDRLFPGDIAQFAAAGGGIGFGHGAAGVLYALAETGAEPWPEAEKWLLKRTEEPDSGTPSASTTASPAPPGPSTGSGTVNAPSPSPNSCCASRGRPSAPTCTAASPESASHWTPWAPRPGRVPCTTPPCAAPNWSPAPPPTSPGRDCCTATPVPPCSSCACTNAPATRNSWREPDRPCTATSTAA